LEQDLTYGEVLFILSQPARAHIWHTLTRFSSAWACNVRVEISSPPRVYTLCPHLSSEELKEIFLKKFIITNTYVDISARSLLFHEEIPFRLRRDMK
jgi:hypothetical protein